MLIRYSTGFFFVVQNSRNLSVRAVYTGDTAVSTVRRPSAHRAYLQEVGRQTMIMKLQCAHLLLTPLPFVNTGTNSPDSRLPLLRYYHLRGRSHPQSTGGGPMDPQPNPIPRPRLFPRTRRRPVRLRGFGSHSAFARVQVCHPRVVRLYDGIAHRPCVPQRRAVRRSECRGIFGYQPVY
jgi:hypothetical protein